MYVFINCEDRRFGFLISVLYLSSSVSSSNWWKQFWFLSFWDKFGDNLVHGEMVHLVFHFILLLIVGCEYF